MHTAAVDVLDPDKNNGATGLPDAPPVVLLPGMIAGGWMWAETPRLLARAGHRVLTFQDPIGVLTNSIDEMTDFVETQLDRMSIDRLTLVGASLGSAVALTYACRHPDRITSLVLSGAPTMVGKADLGILGFGKLTRSIADAAADRLFHDRSRLPDRLVEETYRTFLDRRRLLNMVRLMRASERFDVIAPLQSIDVPTLMVWGEDDRISRCEDWRRLLPHVKRGTFVTIPACGHAPMLEQPDAFNRSLLGFLAARAR